jgi:hypothetical protein
MNKIRMRTTANRLHTESLFWEYMGSRSITIMNLTFFASSLMDNFCFDIATKFDGPEVSAPLMTLFNMGFVMGASRLGSICELQLSWPLRIWD